MADMNYEHIGRFIYGAHRLGGSTDDLENWMADDLGVPRLPAGDEHSARLGEIYRAFFTKYAGDEELQENYTQFMETLKKRAS